MKDSSKTPLLAIRLLEKETIELLKATLEEPPVCRMEELLHLVYIDAALQKVRPEQPYPLGSPGKGLLQVGKPADIGIKADAPAAF